MKIICRHLFHLPFFKLNKDYDYYMKGTFPIHKFRELRTPFYYYDTKVLRDHTFVHSVRKLPDMVTIRCINAVKANANLKVLAIIRENGLGADCVSGGEIRAAIKAGFPLARLFLQGWARLIGKSIWGWIMTFSALMWSLSPSWRLSTSWLPLKVRWPMWLSVSIPM